MKLIFVKLGKFADYCPVTPAASRRDWMDETQQRFAYKCVPLVMANTSGYHIACPFNLRVRWNGSNAANGVEIECLDEDFKEMLPDLFASHFGSGILTFRMPWIIRSDTVGIGAEITGSPNQWIPGLFPLQGMVQTWGHASSATMNWRLQYKDTDFYIPVGFPIAFIRPVSFEMLEQLQVDQVDFDKLDASFREDYDGWRQQRDAVLEQREDVPGLKAHKGAYGKNRKSSGETLPTRNFKPFRLPSLNVGSGTDTDAHESE